MKLEGEERDKKGKFWVGTCEGEDTLEGWVNQGKKQNAKTQKCVER